MTLTSESFGGKKMIKEIFFLRGIACLSIVLLHSIGIGLSRLNENDLPHITFYTLDSIHLLLYFGTPLFIFISELIISYSYRNKKLPKTFLSVRFKYIFIPYLTMALFYSLAYLDSLTDWGKKVLMNIMIGDFHGYFILIIFQFYLIHFLFHRYLRAWSPKVVIFCCTFINGVYLAMFNFTSPPNIILGDYIWDRFYWVPFFGWIFYFSIGYYCGLYYETFLSILKKYKSIILFSPIVTSGVLLYLHYSEIIHVHSSKRLDLLLHTIAICLFLYVIAIKLNKIPKIITVISQYSFGIYLLHMFYLALIDYIYSYFPISIGSPYIFFLFIFSTAASYITINYLRKWKYGTFVIGKIGKDLPSFSEQKLQQIRAN